MQGALFSLSEGSTLTRECFLKQFANAKKPMSPSEAAEYIHRVAGWHSLIPKYKGSMKYIHRLALMTAFSELEEAFRKASPTEDYREIIASFEWPYMRRAVQHMQDGVYDCREKRKLCEADGWIIEMWRAYHDVFRSMPGTIPDIACWRMYDHMMRQVLKKTHVFRRKL